MKIKSWSRSHRVNTIAAWRLVLPIKNKVPRKFLVKLQSNAAYIEIFEEISNAKISMWNEEAVKNAELAIHEWIETAVSFGVSIPEPKEKLSQRLRSFQESFVKGQNESAIF